MQDQNKETLMLLFRLDFKKLTTKKTMENCEMTHVSRNTQI